MYRGAWRSTVHEDKLTNESDMTQWLTHIHKQANMLCNYHPLTWFLKMVQAHTISMDRVFVGGGCGFGTALGLCHSARFSSCGSRAPERMSSVAVAGRRPTLQCIRPLVVACGLCCPEACEILVPRPGIELVSLALEGTFFFPFIFISWRLITLQYCSGFCHTLT